MKAIIFIQILAAVSYCYGLCDDPEYDDLCDDLPKIISVLSDGRQFSCERGNGSPDSNLNRETVEYSIGTRYTCDELPPSHPSYKHDIEVPAAPPNAKETDSFVAITLTRTKNIETFCSRMKPGNETKLGTDKPYHIMTDTKRNLKYICAVKYPAKE